MKKASIPNILTYSRVAAVAVLIPVYYIPGDWGNIGAALIFLYASITDFFDGYLARIWNAQSSMGRFLDPIADKLLVAAALVILVESGRADPVPAIAILCRELLVSGLREFLADLRVPMPVSTLAKYKTGFQMSAIYLLLLGPTAASWSGGEAMGDSLLWVAAILTLITGYVYLREGVKHLSK